MGDFTIRIFKAWNSRLIERAWSNTYEVLGEQTGPTDLHGMALALVDAERGLHLENVNFLQYTISTWVADSTPYDPSSFVTVGVEGTGERGAPADETSALDYNVCLLLKRNAVTGRTGRLYFRGVLLEQDVQMGADGRFSLQAGDPKALMATIDEYTLALAPYIGATLPAQLGLIGRVLHGGGIVTRRPLVSITFGGFTINKHNHRYFDRV